MTRQKRLSVPKSWKLGRKTHHWVTSPAPGPHAAAGSMPLLVLLRDHLHVADLAREVNRILHEGAVQVNGRVARNPRIPCGFFDVISIQKMGRHYAVVPDRHGRISLREIPVELAARKLCRVDGKSTVRGAKIQLHLHDGRNMPGSNDIRTGDSLVLSLADGKVAKHYRREPGARAVVVGGAQSCTLGRVQQLRTMKSSGPNTVTLQGDDGKLVETIEDYVFVIGEEEARLFAAG